MGRWGGGYHEHTLEIIGMCCKEEFYFIESTFCLFKIIPLFFSLSQFGFSNSYSQAMPYLGQRLALLLFQRLPASP